MRRIRGLCCFLVVGMLLSVSGCGGFFVPQTSNSGGGSNTGDYLYVGNTNNTFIAGFGVSTSGALSVLTNSPYNNGVAAQSLTVTPANTFLYAGTTNGIYVYTVNSNGSITVGNSGTAVAQDMVATTMQVDSTGKFLLAAGISTAMGAQPAELPAVTLARATTRKIRVSRRPDYVGLGSFGWVPAPVWHTRDVTQYRIIIIA